jgi:hypothetical protein
MLPKAQKEERERERERARAGQGEGGSVFEREEEEEDDDLLFYVAANPAALPPQDRVTLRRNSEDTSTLPCLGDAIDWKKTYMLNVLLHRVKYRLDVMVYAVAAGGGADGGAGEKGKGKKGRRKEVLARRSVQVYASHTHVEHGSGGRGSGREGTVLRHTYPEICFTVHDAVLGEDSDSSLALASHDSSLAITLTATTPWFDDAQLNAVPLFRGVARYSAVLSAFQHQRQAKASFLSRIPGMGWLAGTGTGDGASAPDFTLQLRGPRGKGRAEMYVRAAADKGAGGAAGGDGGVEPLECSLAFCALPWDEITRDLDAAASPP